MTPPDRNPQWLLQKRLSTCAVCDAEKPCRGTSTLVWDQPDCPQFKMPSRADEIHARAFPAGAPRVSGCCDSVLNSD